MNTIEHIEALAQSGGWLPMEGETCFKTLDGSDVAAFLKRLGFEIAGYCDNGGYGEALTACGIRVSTNGRVKRCFSLV